MGVGKASKIKGKKMMIFVDGKAIALCTNSTLSISVDTGNNKTKDDGFASSPEPTGMSWDMKSENFASSDASRTLDQTSSALADMLLTQRLVDVAFGIPSNASDGELPDAGWTAPKTDVYTGKAYVTNFEVTADVGDYAKCSITLTGVGDLKLKKV